MEERCAITLDRNDNVVSIATDTDDFYCRWVGKGKEYEQRGLKTIVGTFSVDVNGTQWKVAAGEGDG